MSCIIICIIQVSIMSRVESDKKLAVPIRDEYQKIIDESESCHVFFFKYNQINMEHVERFEFYERAKKAYCVVATGETAMYGNIMIQKGPLADIDY